MRRKCRCHGISGSCTTQTCWIQVAPFEEISRKLKDLHRKSVRVTHSAVEKSIIIGNSASDVLVQVKEIPGTENRLIYMVRSPDYCVTNFTEGNNNMNKQLYSIQINSVNIFIISFDFLRTFELTLVTPISLHLLQSPGFLIVNYSLLRLPRHQRSHVL